MHPLLAARRRTVTVTLLPERSREALLPSRHQGPHSRAAARPQLVSYYLLYKAVGEEHCNREIDDYDPDDLPLFGHRTKEEFPSYFGIMKEDRTAAAAPPEVRRSPGGYCRKMAGGDAQQVVYKGFHIGFNRRLVYYDAEEDPDEKKTDWIMHGTSSIPRHSLTFPRSATMPISCSWPSLYQLLQLVSWRQLVEK